MKETVSGHPDRLATLPSERYVTPLEHRARTSACSADQGDRRPTWWLKTVVKCDDGEILRFHLLAPHEDDLATLEWEIEWFAGWARRDCAVHRLALTLRELSTDTTPAQNRQENWEMKVVSVSVGLPREVEWRGRRISTGIFKEPVHRRVSVRKLNLEGDGQADLTVHGGPAKAVYAYPVEHYSYWQAQLARDLPRGMFGENLTTEGLLEGAVNIGDRFRIGTAELVVTQPRMPCFKLGIRFERPDMVKRFLASRRTGWYFSVLQEGDVAAEDKMEPIGRDDVGLSVADVTRLYVGDGDEETLQRAVDHEGLPEDWREFFRIA